MQQKTVYEVYECVFWDITTYLNTELPHKTITNNRTPLFTGGTVME